MLTSPSIPSDIVPQDRGRWEVRKPLTSWRVLWLFGNHQTRFLICWTSLCLHNSARMADTCGAPPPRLPPTHFATVANSARDLIYRGFVGGQMLSISCLGPFGTRLTSSATIAHDFTVGAVSAALVEGQRKHELTFSTLNNQVLVLPHCYQACRR